jgi:hypothetical protein
MSIGDTISDAVQSLEKYIEKQRLIKETAKKWRRVMRDQAGPIPVNYGLIDMGVNVVLERINDDGGDLAQVTAEDVFDSIAEVHRGTGQPEWLRRECEGFEAYLRALDAPATEAAEGQN